MADWSRRFDASYRFMRVSRATGDETERLRGIASGGTLERDLDTDVKESGTVTAVGGFDVGADMVRVWMDAEFPDGSAESVALGTYLVTLGERATDGVSDETAVKLTGRLKELADCEFVQPFSVPAGTNLVSYAKGIAESAGLRVTADASAYTSSSPLYYGVQPQEREASSDSSTKLAVVNDLLDRAGFASARTDAYGNVIFTRSTEIDERPPSWSFTEGSSARFLREATDGADTSTIANTVYAVYSWQPEGGEQRTVIGKAVDSDPASRWSTAAMGREVTARYTYDEPATQEQAGAKAAQLLEQQRSVAREITITHVYAPVTIGDGVDVDYRSGGIQGRFGVSSMRMELGAGCLTETKARRYVRA